VNVGTTFTIYNPDNGEEIIKSVPEVDYIISNLPFIQQEDFQKFNPNVKNHINTKVKLDLEDKFKINGKSDIYAYILIHLYNIISEN
jgi:methylase of polypeptide subunit release factors